jgi:hypothetical protein
MQFVTNHLHYASVYRVDSVNVGNVTENMSNLVKKKSKVVPVLN